MKRSKAMRNIAKIALIVFVSMLEVGYADDCRKELFEKYKAHSAEFIKLKNKCKPLTENVKRLADTYKNTVEYKEYEALVSQNNLNEWTQSAEYREAKMKYSQCINSPEYQANSKRNKELWDISHKTQEYKAYKQALKESEIEINATCKLFLDGVYDIDRAFERIAKVEYKVGNLEKVYFNTPQYKAYLKNLMESDVMEKCLSLFRSKIPYLKAYHKVLETAKKALEPLETAFRNSPELKEYVAECREVMPSFVRNIESHSFEDRWDWVAGNQEFFIMLTIQSIIANRK